MRLARKIIGCILLASPIVGGVILVWARADFALALMVWGAVAVVVWIVALGVWMVAD